MPYQRIEYRRVLFTSTIIPRYVKMSSPKPLRRKELRMMKQVVDSYGVTLMAGLALNPYAIMD
jgi:hypothetical protein